MSTDKFYLDQKFSGAKPRKCWMCGLILTRATATIDHLQPKSKGGKDRWDNYRLACKPCNEARGNKTITKSERLKLQGKPAPKPRDHSTLIAAIKRQKQ